MYRSNRPMPSGPSRGNAVRERGDGAPTQPRHHPHPRSYASPHRPNLNDAPNRVEPGSTSRNDAHLPPTGPRINQGGSRSLLSRIQPSVDTSPRYTAIATAAGVSQTMSHPVPTGPRNSSDTFATENAPRTDSSPIPTGPRNATSRPHPNIAADGSDRPPTEPRSNGTKRKRQSSMDPSADVSHTLTPWVDLLPTTQYVNKEKQ